jgi:hypothetical protein
MQEVSYAKGTSQGRKICIEKLQISDIISGVHHIWVGGWNDLVMGRPDAIETETNNEQNECYNESGAIGHKANEYTEILLRCDETLHGKDEYSDICLREFRKVG